MEAHLPLTLDWGTGVGADPAGSVPPSASHTTLLLAQHPLPPQWGITVSTDSEGENTVY